MTEHNVGKEDQKVQKVPYTRNLRAAGTSFCIFKEKNTYHAIINLIMLSQNIEI